MVLNYIFIAFFLIAFVAALFQWLVLGDANVFEVLMKSTFESSKTGFELSIGLTGVLTLWLGLMKVGEKGGAVNIIARLIGPFFKRIFPELPANHPAYGSMILNIAANMLGLDNAATPMGLKAMEQMQELNKDKETATNSQIMFLVLNTSGLTIIPISIMMYRAQLGAANPADVFIPILIATFFSTLVGLIAVAIFQKINLFNWVVLSYIGGLTAVILGIIGYFSTLTQAEITQVSNVASSFILFSIIVSFIALAFFRKVNVYEAFIEGAKEGFTIAIKIIPYLVAILVAIAVFRASGAMDLLVGGIESLVVFLGFDSRFVAGLPTALMKPLSGSGARGMMIDAMKQYGADSFEGRLACTLQGAADTTFYIIAVYFGSVGIRKTRHAIAGGLIADLAGVIASIIVAYIFFAGE